MDFVREGHNAERFAALNRDESAVFVPRVFWQATTMRVLTMEHSPGHRADAQTPDPARHAQFSATLMRLFLTPQFNSLDAFRAYSTRLLKHVMLPDFGVAQIAELYRFGTAVREVAGGAPLTLQRLMGRLERGEPLFDIRHQSSGSLERHMLHASNRLAFALIIASIVIGSSVLIVTHAGPHLDGIPILGIIGFMAAAVLGTAWAVIALRSGKL